MMRALAIRDDLEAAEAALAQASETVARVRAAITQPKLRNRPAPEAVLRIVAQVMPAIEAQLWPRFETRTPRRQRAA